MFFLNMTTISPNRRHRRLSHRVVLSILIVASVLMAVLWWRSAIEGLLWYIGNPLLSARNEAHLLLQTTIAQFRTNATLAEENTRLRVALASTTVLLLDRDLVVSENKELAAHLGRIMAQKSLLGAVLMRPPGVPYDTLVIDVGARDGVVKGDRVSAGGNTDIGVVADVYTSTSRVVLLSAAGQTHEATLLSKTGIIPLVLSGRGAGTFFGVVPAGSIIEIGDMALFPGMGEHMIARVSAVETLLGASFANVYLRFPFNIFSLRFVEVHPQ